MQRLIRREGQGREDAADKDVGAVRIVDEAAIVPEKAQAGLIGQPAVRHRGRIDDAALFAAGILPLQVRGDLL